MLRILCSGVVELAKIFCEERWVSGISCDFVLYCGFCLTVNIFFPVGMVNVNNVIKFILNEVSTKAGFILPELKIDIASSDGYVAIVDLHSSGDVVNSRTSHCARGE